MIGKRMFRLSTVLLILTALGIKPVQAADNDPAKKAKSEFSLHYGFFITSDIKVSYYKDALGLEDKESKIFDKLKTIESVDKFIEIFWKVRDPNRATPENEFKDGIDQRIQDIENEIFVADNNIPGTRFQTNGGLRGDMAHIYLLYGQPNYKDRLSENFYHTDLMVWYYFDVLGKQVFRFLFYKDYGPIRVFKEYVPILSLESLIDPTFSPLRRISKQPSPTSLELYQLWVELEREDPQAIFRSALIEFSYYQDVTIDRALKAPEPAVLTAERTKPTFLGQPEDLSDKKFLNNSYHSFIPAELKINKDNRPSFTLITGYSDLDWEVRGDQAEFVLDLRISFQNKETLAIKEFSARLLKAKPLDEVEKKRGIVIMEILLDDILNFAQIAKPQQTLGQLIDNLEPGHYIINVDLRHAVTKKSAGGWREEIIIE